MKNASINTQEKLASRFTEGNPSQIQPKSSDINVLLNRIKLNKKNENKKKIYFSIAASTGLILFGFIISF